jgi:hypothetical protein
MTRTSTITRIVAASLLVGLGTGCKRQQTDNPDVAAGFRDNPYEKDIVTGQARKNYEDQGDAISPKVLKAIEETIEDTYRRDFERCLEDEMAKFETRFLRAVFTLEFKIDTSGQASEPKVLEVAMSQQDAKGADKGPVDPSGLTECIVGVVPEWVFDPPPEVDYVHTYTAQIGEAF